MMSKRKRKRLGRVVVDLSYVVDLDDADMIQHAKDCLYEDLMNAYKYNELPSWFEVIPDPKATKDEIPEFLLEGK